MNKQSVNNLITILTYVVGFILGDIINGLLGINGGKLLSLNTVLSIIVLLVSILSVQYLVSKFKGFLGK